jgi:hypothetical protein
VCWRSRRREDFRVAEGSKCAAVDVDRSFGVVRNCQRAVLEEIGGTLGWYDVEEVVGDRRHRSAALVAGREDRFPGFGADLEELVAETCVYPVACDDAFEDASELGNPEDGR